ncbi:MAG: PorT family protein [Bacteroidaceae bacterium]|nr:PorT family protein [Bacteroidaceae bacterium]
MKKLFSIFVLSALSVGLATKAEAQVGSPRDMKSLGFNAGMGTSSVSFVPKIKQDISLGPTFGITFRHISEKYFFLICGTQLECNFAGRGWTELIEDGSGNEYTRNSYYVEVPFFAHLGIGREVRGFQTYLNIGPQVGYLIGEKEIFGGREPWNPSNRPNNVTDQYNHAIENKLDYGITAGLGLEMRTGIGIIGFEGRYYFGLGNIFGITKKDYFARCANSTISLRAHYMFSL